MAKVGLVSCRFRLLPNSAYVAPTPIAAKTLPNGDGKLPIPKTQPKPFPRLGNYFELYVSIWTLVDLMAHSTHIRCLIYAAKKGMNEEHPCWGGTFCAEAAAATATPLRKSFRSSHWWIDFWYSESNSSSQRNSRRLCILCTFQRKNVQ